MAALPMFIPPALIGGAVGFAKGGLPAAIVGASTAAVLSWPAATVGGIVGGSLVNALTDDANCAMTATVVSAFATGVATSAGCGYLSALATAAFWA